MKQDNEQQNIGGKNIMAHYNVSSPERSKENLELTPKKTPESYSVPKCISQSMFSRRGDIIREFLAGTIGLTDLETTAILKMVQLYAHYGKVYPKAQTLADDCGQLANGYSSYNMVSKRTTWRAIKKLEDMGLLRRQNQFYQDNTGEVRQTSNIYHLDKLVLMLARRLAEAGQAIHNRFLAMMGKLGNFWQEIWDPGFIVNLDSCFMVKKLPT